MYLPFKGSTGQALIKTCLLTTLASLFFTAWGTAVRAEEEHAGAAHSFHRHHTALFLGNTQDDKGDEHGLSVGVDYVYRLNQWMGLGGKAEYAGGDFKHFMLLAGASLHPYKNWVLIVVGGAEVHNEHDVDGEDERKREWLIRTGVGYQIHLSERYSIVPEFNVDFSEHETLFVYGVSIGMGF